MENLPFNDPNIFAPLILVDEADQPIGQATKLEVHQQGLRHRAFSVFVIRRTQTGFECLMQRRHPDKYHSGGLWANTTCGHPEPDEELAEAAEKRLQYEMGVETALKHIGVFEYCARVGPFIEREVDHVFLAIDDVITDPHPDEVIEEMWMPVAQLIQDLGEQPEAFVPWLLPAMSLVTNALMQEYHGF